MLLLFVFSSDEDRKKFEYLYERYKRLMLLKAHDLLRDDMLAEDAVSEAFIRVFNNLDKIDDPTTVRSAAYLYTIVRNVALTMLRREGRLKMQEMPDEPPADSFNLEDSVISRMNTQQMLDVMAQLSEEIRSVFVLKYAYGYTNREIATALDMSESLVAVRLHRAKGRIAELLRKEGLA